MLVSVPAATGSHANGKMLSCVLYLCSPVGMPHCQLGRPGWLDNQSLPGGLPSQLASLIIAFLGFPVEIPRASLSVGATWLARQPVDCLHSCFTHCCIPRYIANVNDTSVPIHRVYAW